MHALGNITPDSIALHYRTQLSYTSGLALPLPSLCSPQTLPSRPSARPLGEEKKNQTNHTPHTHLSPCP